MGMEAVQAKECSPSVRQLQLDGGPGHAAPLPLHLPTRISSSASTVFHPPASVVILFSLDSISRRTVGSLGACLHSSSTPVTPSRQEFPILATAGENPLQRVSKMPPIRHRGRAAGSRAWTRWETEVKREEGAGPEPRLSLLYVTANKRPLRAQYSLD